MMDLKKLGKTVAPFLELAVLFLSIPALIVAEPEPASEQLMGAFVYARYHDPCNASVPCDHDANFECHAGRCRCSKPQVMIYNPEALECRIKSGSKCVYHVERDELERKLHIAHRLIFSCTSNATCGDDGICHCTPYYYQDHRGRCIEKKGMNRDCHHYKECDDEAGLICWRGRCGCDPSKSRRPVGYGPPDTCVGIPREPCINGLCELNSECVGGRCICIPGFQYDLHERRCIGMFDEPCVDDSYCGEHFSCVGFRCKCRGPDQVFDDVLQRCYSIVGDACSRDEECVPHAICKTDGTGKPLCQCDESYVEFGPGFCRNGYGLPCLEKKDKRTYLVEKDSLLASSFTDFERPSEDGTGFDSLVLIKVEAEGCDTSRKLRCRKGHCVCKEGVEIYSHRLGKCISLADTLCHIHEFNNCVKHADCTPVLGQEHTEIGRCNCVQGYMTGPNRFCIEKPQA